MKKIFFILFILSCIIFFLHTKVVGNAVYGDGFYYYSYVKSFIAEGRLPAPNKYSFMPSIFWVVPYFFTYLIYGESGNELIYQLITGFTSIFFAIVGLYLIFLTLLKYFSKWISFLSVFGIWISTHVFFYTSIDPINSHAVSFFTSSLIVYFLSKYLLDKNNRKGILNIFILGFLISALTLIRNHDGIFLLPILVIAYLRNKKNSIIILLGFIPLIVFQFLVWFLISGSINSPYITRGESFFWTSPHFIGVLFGYPNGLFLVSPILLLSVGGLIWTYRKYRLSPVGIVLFLLQCYVLGSWQYWQGGAAFGGRMFLSLMPFLALGLGSILKELKYKVFQIVLISFFTIFNILAMVVFLISNP